MDETIKTLLQDENSVKRSKMNQQILTSLMAFNKIKKMSSNQQQIAQGLLDLSNSIYNF